MTTPFFYRWIPVWMPSWAVEVASGAVLVLGFALVLMLPRWLAVGLLATAANVVYEQHYDPHGWELRDALPREAAIVVLIAAWALLA